MKPGYKVLISAVCLLIIGSLCQSGLAQDDVQGTCVENCGGEEETSSSSSGGSLLGNLFDSLFSSDSGSATPSAGALRQAALTRQIATANVEGWAAFKRRDFKGWAHWSRVLYDANHSRRPCSSR